MAVERLETPGDEVWQDSSADHLARYEFALRYAAGKRVLDAGAGIGYGAMLLATGGAASVVGIDIDAKSVATARSRFVAPNLAYKVGDCETLEVVEGNCEVICNFENIEHLQRPDEFLRSAARKLAPGGVLLCSTPDRAITPPFVNGRPANPYHVNEWYREEFKAMLVRSFRSVEMFAQVKTYAQARREVLARALGSYAAIIRQPAIRALLKIGRTIRLLSAEAYPRPLSEAEGMAIAEPSAFPVVPEAVVSLYGTGWCHLAVCRDPIA